MKTVDSFIALNRFGLGAGPGDADVVASDPRGWLRAQVGDPARVIGTNFTPSETILRDIQTARKSGSQELRKTTRRAYRQEFRSGITARMKTALQTDAPFAERLALFWSNHFTVSTTKSIIGPAIPAFEREAIRLHVFGRFADMLRAVERHPVMLSYLDNVASAGENSEVGTRRRRRTGATKTINENLAREILELHTLGVNGGYTQSDVLGVAYAISGWGHGGFRMRRDTRQIHGGFEFHPYLHEPGPKVVLGKTYAQDGPDQGLAVLDDLARHPATAQHIAQKLVRHFVTDDPPADAVAQIAQVFQQTDGDLAATSHTLIDLEAAWADPLAKVKTPYELMVAVHRAVGLRQIKGRDTMRVLEQMAHMPFAASSPQGWGDNAKDWISPEALMARIEWVRRFSARLSGGLIPAQVLEATIGAVASPATHQWVARAPSGDAGLAIIFASPEFQRR